MPRFKRRRRGGRRRSRKHWARRPISRRPRTIPHLFPRHLRTVMKWCGKRWARDSTANASPTFSKLCINSIFKPGQQDHIANPTQVVDKTQPFLYDQIGLYYTHYKVHAAKYHIRIENADQNRDMVCYVYTSDISTEQHTPEKLCNNKEYKKYLRIPRAAYEGHKAIKYMTVYCKCKNAMKSEDRKRFWIDDDGKFSADLGASPVSKLYLHMSLGWYDHGVTSNMDYNVTVTGEFYVDWYNRKAITLSGV